MRARARARVGVRVRVRARVRVRVRVGVRVRVSPNLLGLVRLLALAELLLCELARDLPRLRLRLWARLRLRG